MATTPTAFHKNNRYYTLPTISFLILFLISLFFFFTRSYLLEPNLTLYRNLFSQPPLIRNTSLNYSPPPNFTIVDPNPEFSDNTTNDSDSVLDFAHTGEEQHPYPKIIAENEPSFTAEIKWNRSTVKLVDNSFNYYVGKWVRDEEHYSVYKVGTCPFVDEAFDCGNNVGPTLAIFIGVGSLMAVISLGILLPHKWVCLKRMDS